ncbi:hypothetical protein Egran_03515 [Elaphomyces granulatus]|uniref:Elongation of fatty acids protein n=1 Tax=Elaphomyces granulatus TaxID=519963 RepID=A0A232LX50_9EURO|nr:hypothetical protein Egran_03515 [Elaphomyces granulatus]
MLGFEAAGPTVEFALPPNSLFSFPPASSPFSLPPAPVERSWERPFSIPPALFTQLLDARVPITVAGLYAATVIIVNSINESRGYKPWAFSRTRVFRLLVILHNVFLAGYSTWTFVGMFHVFRRSMPSRRDPNGIVAIADALCRITGPRGLGNAAMYNPTADQWVLPNPEFTLGKDGLPDPTDVGRLWNEGLAFFGWIFYLSKFYEVLDTVIILAKGKRSSTLQIYHHTGAMMCMWAGIRYIGPPIWVFALVNSGIHALMYTYYTLTALSLRIPNVVKRTLTTVQITQFVLGSMMAAIHLFIRYTIPVQVVTSPSALQLASVPLPSMASVAESGINATTATSKLEPWLKVLALRAAGAGGVAENVMNMQKQHSTTDEIPMGQFSQAEDAPQKIVQYRMVNCIDTTGQSFAIWLNVMYLLPLTYLFARFFVRAYLYRKDPGTTHPTPNKDTDKAGLGALKEVSQEIHKAVIEMHGGGDSTDDEDVDSSRSPETLPAVSQDVSEGHLSEKPNGVPNGKSDSELSATPAKHRAKKAHVEPRPQRSSSTR